MTQVNPDALRAALETLQACEMDRQWCDSDELSDVEQSHENARFALLELLAPRGRAEDAEPLALPKMVAS